MDSSVKPRSHTSPRRQRFVPRHIALRIRDTNLDVSLSGGSKTSLQMVVAAICRISAGAAASALTFSNINCHQRPHIDLIGWRPVEHDG